MQMQFFIIQKYLFIRETLDDDSLSEEECRKFNRE